MIKSPKFDVENHQSKCLTTHIRTYKQMPTMPNYTSHFAQNGYYSKQLHLLRKINKLIVFILELDCYIVWTCGLNWSIFESVNCSYQDDVGDMDIEYPLPS